MMASFAWQWHTHYSAPSGKLGSLRTRKKVSLSSTWEIGCPYEKKVSMFHINFQWIEK